MPFAPSLKKTYSAIQKACRGLRLSVERGDDIFSSANVIDEIWEAINNCGVLVADCTTRNPNVFYEIGIAHTLGKEVILISQSKEDVPFDVNHIRYLSYLPSPTGLRKLTDDLKKPLRTTGKEIWNL